MSYVQFGILGMGAVAVYVLLAQGVVLIYRASGVVNFAQGAFAMVGAYFFYETHVVSKWPLGLALVFSIFVCAVLGAAVSILVIRPLRRSSPLARLIATLAILSVLETGAIIRYTTNIVFYPTFLPHAVLHTASVNLPEDRVWLLVIALVCTIGLHLAATRTRFGLATFGVSESELTAETLGWSPGSIGAINWAVGGALAALAGILIVPIDGLSPSSLTLLLIPGLAAALVGNFSSFGLTLLGAAILGITQSEIAGHVTSPDLSGIPAAVPFLVIVVMLVVRGRPLPLRGYVFQRLPTIGSGRIRIRYAGPVFLVAIALLLFLPVGWIPFFTISEIATLFLLSIVILTGYAGQLSLAQYAVGGVAALIAGRLVATAGVPFTIALFIGVAASVVTGLVFAIPALRTRGITLAVVTIGLGVAVYEAVFSDEAFTGFGNSITVGPQRFLGINIDPLLQPRNFALFALFWVIVGCVITGNVRRSRAGRRLIAVRTNERAAAALGVNVYGAKLYAFAVSATLAGLAGVLLAFDGYSAVFTGFTPTASITLVEQAVLGGLGYIVGIVFGGQFAADGVGTLIGRGIVGASAFEWVTLIGSALVIVIILQNPDGVTSANIKIMKAVGARLYKRSGRPVPMTVAEAVPGSALGELAASAGVATGETAEGDRGVRAPSALPENGDIPVEGVDAAGSRSRAVADARGHSPAPLEARGVTVTFGGIRALTDVGVTVQPGEIVGLIGPNGAGKTTLIDVISGFVRQRSGSVTVGGVDIDGWSAFRRARAGVTRTFQGLELFDDLTVMDNLRAAADRSDGMGYLSGLVKPDEPELPPIAVAVIGHFGLAPHLQSMVRELPYGLQRLVSVARAVAANPAVLLLDEPTSGLDEQESTEFIHILRSIPRRWGIGILLVEHDMSVIMRLCQRIVVLDFGAVIAEGSPEEIRRNPKVIAAYLGQESEELAANPANALHSAEGQS
jgi:ABC-type branched-subunit amino acid transport system ATPase component/branched-subunit amino acid ABC-type transport system permease component